jgi:hypothetical protein
MHDMNASYQWIVDNIPNFEYDVGSLIPPVFESYARVFHPAYRDIRTPDGYRKEITVSWHAVARANDRVAHPAMEWGSLVGSWHGPTQPGLWDRQPDNGQLPVPETRELSRILQQYTHSDSVMYAVWEGYSILEDYDLGNVERFELPFRTMYMKSGSIDDAVNPFGIPDMTANLWWPSDQQWCVATDIDLMTTYVGGNTRCIQAIISSDALEAMPVTSDQRITWDTDTINPLPERPSGLPNP